MNPDYLLHNAFFPEIFHAVVSMLALLTFLTVGFFVAMITVAPELSLSSKTCANQLYHSGQSEKIRIVKALANSSLEHQF